MADSNFIDYVKVLCRSGKGGAGSRHFYRAKYVPKGGPDGGDGHYCLCAIAAIYLPATAKAVPGDVLLERTEKM